MLLRFGDPKPPGAIRTYPQLSALSHFFPGAWFQVSAFQLFQQSRANPSNPDQSRPIQTKKIPSYSSLPEPIRTYSHLFAPIRTYSHLNYSSSSGSDLGAPVSDPARTSPVANAPGRRPALRVHSELTAARVSSRANLTGRNFQKPNKYKEVHGLTGKMEDRGILLTFPTFT
jgi:hypothetical protein